MRKFLLPFFAFILLLGLLRPVNVFAQTPAPSAATEDTSSIDSSGDAGFQVSPEQKDITDFTPKVTVTFPEFEKKNYFVCLRSDYCLHNVVGGLMAQTKDTLLANATTTGVAILNVDTEYFKKTDYKLNDKNSIVVCGKNNNDLKSGDCNDKRDYFHAGNFYSVIVYVEQEGSYLAVQRAGFYVSRGMPNIKVSQDKLTLGAHFSVDLSQDVIRPGGRNRNNYAVVLSGPGLLKKNECDHLDTPKTTMTFNYPLMRGEVQHYVDADSQSLLDSGYTLPGKYVFRITEQTNEGDANRITEDVLRRGDNDCNSGGFTYATVTCTVSADPDPKKHKACGDPVFDPDKKDAKQLLDLLNKIAGNSDAPFLPCKEGEKGVINPLDCQEIDTAIGSIKLDPIGFITRIFQIVLAIAGVGALFLIIYSGYRMLLSRGNKEMIQGARETITAAIIGLLFIIFSLVILSVITGNILKLPGFS